MRILSLVALLTLSILAGCGGGDTAEPAANEAERLRAAAALKRQELEGLVQTSPCSDASQCATLVLKPQLAPCFFQERLDHSTASAGADAAVAAAAQYNALSAIAHALEPPSNLSGSCFENVDATPLACVANRCVRSFVIGAAP